MIFSLDMSLLTLMVGFFSAGFLGSWHCAVMCGPMSCFLTSKKQLWSYQMGRLLSYVLAGAMAGGVSQFLVQSYIWLKYVSIVLISFLLIFNFLDSRKIQGPVFLSRYFFRHKENTFLLGFLTVFLPCGWLYTFILSALAARSVLGGALVMFSFYLSTVPALSIAQVLMKKLIDQNDYRRQKIASIVLLGSSLLSLWAFLAH